MNRQDISDVAAKLRITVVLLGCAGQKELCAAFRRVNPGTDFDVTRSYKWMQGRSLPRSPRVYEDWAVVLGLDRGGEWIMSCTLDAFADAIGARHGLDPESLLLRAEVDRPASAAAAAGEYLCGVYATFTNAQSPYHGGRVTRGSLVIEPAPRRAAGLIASYFLALPFGRAYASGPVLGSTYAVSLELREVSDGAAPAYLSLFRPAAPASVLAGMQCGFAMVNEAVPPPYATRIVLVRAPLALAELEASNRFMEPVGDSPAADLAALGLPVGALAEELDARVAACLGGGTRPRGSERVDATDFMALTAVCNRLWIDCLARTATAPGAGRADGRARLSNGGGSARPNAPGA